MANQASQQPNQNYSVTYKTERGDEITLSSEFAKKNLARGKAANHVTDKEAILFVEECRYRGLNPFIGEIYLIKNSADYPANFPVSKDVFLRRAQKNAVYGGFTAGVVVQTANGSIAERVGGLPYPEESLLGGWAKVSRKDWERPAEISVSIAEYKSGTASWRDMPATMIRKVAIAQAHREAFPEELGGLYSEDELDNKLNGGGSETPVKPGGTKPPGGGTKPAAPDAKTSGPAGADTTPLVNPGTPVAKAAEEIASVVDAVFVDEKKAPAATGSSDGLSSYRVISHAQSKTKAGDFFLKDLVLAPVDGSATVIAGATGATALEINALPAESIVAGYLSPSKVNPRVMVFTLEKYARLSAQVR